MARIYRIDITKENCWLCDHFRRHVDGDVNKGSCTRFAPKARGAFLGGNAGTSQDLSGADIDQPDTTWCGDFKKWTGPAREIDIILE